MNTCKNPYSSEIPVWPQLSLILMWRWRILLGSAVMLWCKPTRFPSQRNAPPCCSDTRSEDSWGQPSTASQVPRSLLRVSRVRKGLVCPLRSRYQKPLCVNCPEQSHGKSAAIRQEKSQCLQSEMQQNDGPVRHACSLSVSLARRSLSPPPIAISFLSEQTTVP